jgi:hypothetical protein
MTVAVSDIARVVLEQVIPGTPARVVLSVPRNEYRVELVLNADAAQLAGREGKRIQGVIRGKALRMWNARAGGCFIEPIWGHPRIVQGRTLATDLERNSVLLDMVVPAWFELEMGQNAADFQTGDMLNFYVESGVNFTPLPEVAHSSPS